MEIHKPKAAHSWREFTIEIGTIICGILIALSLEQAVEAVHRHKEIIEVRRGLDAEVADNLASDDLIASQFGCANLRLDELSRWRSSMDGDRPIKLTARVIGPMRRNLRTSVWKVASSGTLAQMPFEARVGYGRVYDLTDLIENQEKDIGALWRELSKLSLSPGLDAGQRVELQYDINALRRSYSVLEINLNELRGHAREVGVTKAATDAVPEVIRKRASAICEPLLPAA